MPNSSPPARAPAALSVVIPTHNTVDLTLACLASLAGGGISDLSVIVVDDGSSDGTAAAIAARWPAVRVLCREVAGGFGAAANAGLAAADGDLLLLLNSDTEVRPGALAALVRAFDADPRLGVAGARLLNPDGSPQWSGGPEPSLAWLFAQASGLPERLGRLPGYRRLRPVAGAAEGQRVAWVSGAAMALRRAVWQEVGPFDLGYRFYAQDVDLCCAARRAGFAVEIVPGFEVVHHHGATISRRPGAASGQHPELLWTDLLRWAVKHRGPRWAERARRALLWGARWRSREDRGAFAAAAAAVRRFEIGAEVRG